MVESEGEDAAISHITRQANDMLPCPSRGGWRCGMLYTHVCMRAHTKLGGHADSVKHWGAGVGIRRYGPALTNPAGGAGTPQVGCTMLRVMVWAPRVPPGPHPLLNMDGSLTFASPVITRYPLMLQLAGGAT